MIVEPAISFGNWQEIFIDTEPFADVVATSGNDSYVFKEKTDEDGSLYMDLFWPENGGFSYYSIVATLDGEPISEEVRVDRTQEFTIVKDPVSDLKQNTILTISSVAEYDDPSKIWNVGDEIVIPFPNSGGNWDTLTFQIAGFHHDDISYSGSYGNGKEKAGITFVTKGVLPDTLESVFFCNRRSYGNLLTGLIDKLTFYSRSRIPSITKKWNDYLYAGGFRLQEETGMKFFMLSETEVTGNNNNSPEGEGSQYELFKNVENQKRKTQDGDGEYASWWLGSPYRDSAASNSFSLEALYVTETGEISWEAFANSAQKRPTCVGFCL